MKIKINLNRSRKHSAITENISCKLLTNKLFQNKAECFLYAPWHWTRRKPEELLNQRFSDTGQQEHRTVVWKKKNKWRGSTRATPSASGCPNLRARRGTQTGPGSPGWDLGGVNAAGYLVSQWQVQDKEAAQETDRRTGTERWSEHWRLQGGPLSKDIWALCGQELPGLGKSHWKRAGWEIAGVTQAKKNLCPRQPEWKQKP